MADVLIPLVVFFWLTIIIVLPLWLILHYSTKRRQAQGLTREDEKMLADLWQLANKMESRVNALESILETQAPRWRDKV